MEIENNQRNSNGQGLIRLIAFLLLAAAGLAVAYTVDQNAEEKAKVEAEHYQEEKAQITLSKIRAFLLNATQLSETLRVLVEQYGGDDPKQIEEYLDRIVESAPEDLIYGAGIWYEPYPFDTKSLYVGPYVHRGPRPGSRILTKEWENPDYNFHKQEWYALAVQAKGAPAFAEPYFDNGMVYMTLAVAFNDRKTGKIKGVVTIDMILPQLQHLIDAVNEHSSDIITVTGKSGRLLAHPRSRELLLVAQAKEKPGTIQSILDVPSQYFRDNVWSSIVSETTMKENGWKVAVTSPRVSIMSAYLNQRTLTIILTLTYEGILVIVFVLITLFNESITRLKERSFQALMSERNQIKAIVDNVQFGLFRADRLGRIQSGYSQSCRALLSLEPGTELGRRTFWHFFHMTPREEANFEAFYEQVFEVSFLADEMADQIPSQIYVYGKILSCRYYPIKKGDEVESVLVSFSDVSRSHLTEIENENNKALVRILRNKDRFAIVVGDIFHTEDIILSPMAWPQSDDVTALRRIKRLVHTWKGDLSAFGLNDAVSFIHQLEDSLRDGLSLTSSREFMKTLKSILVTYLEKHYAILRITPGRIDERQVTVSEQSLVNLQKKIASALDAQEAYALMENFIDQSTMEKGEDILSYLSITAQEMARRQEKALRMETRGGSVTLPQQYATLLSSLNHVVRNAVDHGIEKTRDRLGKTLESKIEIEISEDRYCYKIVIADDGRGIDREKLKESVLARGLCTSQAWDALTPDAQLRYIFEESVTTNSHVTLISGRGVGLDKVLSAVEEQGGEISVSTKLGQGTSFEIILPKGKSSPTTSGAVDSLVS